MLVVADHRFFKYMGRGEESTTINYLVSKYTLLQFAGVNGRKSDSVVKNIQLILLFYNVCIYIMTVCAFHLEKC